MSFLSALLKVGKVVKDGKITKRETPWDKDRKTKRNDDVWNKPRKSGWG
jgi:hypothetical protein